MDIDIDFPSNFNLTDIIKEAIPASMVKKGELVKHPCGYYLQTIPVDSYTGLAAIPYDQAVEYDYFKIDFLHLSLLDNFKTKQEIRDLIKIEPNWKLLTDSSVVPKLFQLHKNYPILAKIKPRSVQEVADCIALIRPGKREYLEPYMIDKEKVRPYLYRGEADNKSAFKRSHAIAYALTVVLQLHLISQGKL